MSHWTHWSHHSSGDACALLDPRLGSTPPPQTLNPPMRFHTTLNPKPTDEVPHHPKP